MSEPGDPTIQPHRSPTPSVRRLSQVVQEVDKLIPGGPIHHEHKLQDGPGAEVQQAEANKAENDAATIRRNAGGEIEQRRAAFKTELEEQQRRELAELRNGYEPGL